MSWVSMAATATGGLMQAKGLQDAGRAEQAASNEQAYQSNLEAEQVRQASRDQADRIRRAGTAVRSQARAAYGASGVSVDVGTPTTVDNQIEQDAESDAYAAILSGRRQAKNLDYQADQMRRRGASAASAGNTAAKATVLSTVGSLFGQWNGMSR